LIQGGGLNQKSEDIDFEFFNLTNLGEWEPEIIEPALENFEEIPFDAFNFSNIL